VQFVILEQDGAGTGAAAQTPAPAPKVAPKAKVDLKELPFSP
jgi:hypothetical protein